jgi:hypothetical protein
MAGLNLARLADNMGTYFPTMSQQKSTFDMHPSGTSAQSVFKTATHQVHLHLVIHTIMTRPDVVTEKISNASLNTCKFRKRSLRMACSARSVGVHYHVTLSM